MQCWLCAHHMFLSYNTLRMQGKFDAGCGNFSRLSVYSCWRRLSLVLACSSTMLNLVLACSSSRFSLVLACSSSRFSLVLARTQAPSLALSLPKHKLHPGLALSLPGLDLSLPAQAPGNQVLKSLCLFTGDFVQTLIMLCERTSRVALAPSFMHGCP